MSFEQFSAEIGKLFLNENDLNQIQRKVNEYLVNKSSRLPGNRTVETFFGKLRKKAASDYERIKKQYDFKERKSEKIRQIQKIFFPENLLDYEKTAEAVREKRRVRITKKSENRIKNPYKEVLITANVLLTMPENSGNIPEDFLKRIDLAKKQKYWYDHPVPIDAPDSENEIIYGLEKLNESLSVETEEKVTVVLSVSCTHNSLNTIAKDYLREIFKNQKLDHLKVYAFTEEDVGKMLELIFPGDNEKLDKMKETIGVQGKYGRHYSFLKAVAVFWKYYVDSNIKATFKIDLDQVFDQTALKKYTGKYAFENFNDDLWGASGTDSSGEEVRLGMIAGSLVNDYDIDKSLFFPDVKKPDSSEMAYDKFIFNSPKPQYISTIAEMGTRYKKGDNPIIRYHVTGGTNGILVEDLISYKPFTPGFIGRAEDQAFILSIIDKKVDGKYLRYYHCDSLVMRHDKHSLVKRTIEKSETSKMVGDYERILLFSYYADKILNKYDYIKKELFPFTACFISKIPYITIYFRALLKAYALAGENEVDAEEFLLNLSDRLNNVIEHMDNDYYYEQYFKEKQAWEGFYNHFDGYKRFPKSFISSLSVSS